MYVVTDAPGRAFLLEIAVAQTGGEISKRAVAINAFASALDRVRARVAGKNLDGRFFEPSSFVQGDGYRQRLLASGAGGAPNAQGRTGIGSLPFRHQFLDQRSHLIDLSPEISLLYRQRVQHFLPLQTRRRVVLQQVVIIEV